MVAQDIFDDVLLSCDAALIRGEDSVLRAQLAGIPMIWTLYPQQEDTPMNRQSHRRIFSQKSQQGIPERNQLGVRRHPDLHQIIDDESPRLIASF